jgi:hypothetical protein
VFLLAHHLGRALADIGLDRVPERREHGRQRAQLLRVAVLHARRRDLAGHGLPGRVRQPLDRMDQVPRGPVTDALDGGQVGEADRPDDEHDQPTLPGQGAGLLAGGRGGAGLHVDQRSGVRGDTVAETLQLVGVRDAGAALQGKLSALSQRLERPPDGPGLEDQRRVAELGQVLHRLLDGSINDGEALLGRSRREPVNRLHQRRALRHQVLDLLQLVGGHAVLVRGRFHAPQQHADRDHESHRPHDGHTENDREMMVNAHGSSGDRSSRRGRRV